MKNFRIHEALCHMFPESKDAGLWRIEQGPHTDGEITITEWGLEAPKPTQEQLDAVYAELARLDHEKELANDVPVGEVDRLLADFPTVGWDILKLRGIE